MKEPQTIRFQTQGTCCKLIQITISDNKIVDSEFLGGCNGNLQGIKQLITGMDIEDVIKRLNGIQCGDKQTSCPDQLAQCLIAYKNTKQNINV